MKTLPLTPQLIQTLSYYTLCRLADYLKIVCPLDLKEGDIEGTITLDDRGNYISAAAKLTE